MKKLGGVVVLCMMVLMGVVTTPAHAQQGQEKVFDVEIRKGTLIRLGRAAATVIVADPSIADVQVVSPAMVYLRGNMVGETSIVAVDNAGGEILNATVNVTHNISKLNKALKEAMPDADIALSSVDGALVMQGNVSSPIEMENVRRMAAPFAGKESIINMVNTEGSDQVTLMVKVAEVARSELKRFGINLEGLVSPGNFVFGLANGRDVVNSGGDFLRSSIDNSIFGNYQSGNRNISGVIDALADEGLITILAEPNLTAMSGQPASFLAGGEFPIPVVGQEGEVTIEYKPFGVSLNFTPTVLSKDKISLAVNPEVSTLSEVGSVTTNGFNIPSLVTRRAATAVELGSGQTFAIAGLLQVDTSNDISKFPALGDLPILGALFRSSEFKNNQTELVILVTPYIVSGVSDKKMALPTDGFTPPSDLERILLGKLYHEHGGEPPSYPNAGTKASKQPLSASVMAGSMPRLNGPGGFMLR